MLIVRWLLLAITGLAGAEGGGGASTNCMGLILMLIEVSCGDLVGFYILKESSLGCNTDIWLPFNAINNIFSG